MKIFVLGSYGPSLVNFRGDMIKSMVENGHEVIACAPDDEGDLEDRITRLGARYSYINLKRTGMNPIEDFILMCNLIKKLKKEKPDVFLSYTIKPNIYGSIAAYMCGIKNVYGMLTGAGSVIRSTTLKMKLIQFCIIPLYRMAFKKSKVVFFLNNDDLELFKSKKIVIHQKTVVLGSSGINLQHFTKKDLLNSNVFLFIARLIRDKGIFEFLEAAKIAKKKRPDMIFKILGPFDSNPTAITKNQLEKWTNLGVVEYLGSTRDVRPFIDKSFVVVLPSYHEGQGRVLAEAMATGRAVIATDVPGCRQTVVDGLTGYLVPSRDSKSLAEKMIYMYDNPEVSISMSEEGYKRAVKLYDVKKINNIILNEMGLRV